MKSIYSTPKVVSYEDLSKSWFVYFRYNKKLFRFKYGINYIQNYEERLIEANALRDALIVKLKEGWNPSTPDTIESQTNLNLIEAIDYCLKKKSSILSKNTNSNYKCTSNFLKDAIYDLKFNSISIHDIKRIHVKSIIDKVKEQRNSSNNSYNKYLSHFGAILSQLIDDYIIEVNPANNIKRLPVEESIFHTPASINDIEKIKVELSNNYPNFYNFIAVIFHLGIRPSEILKIKLSMINFETEVITLIPKNTKSRKKYRVLPINKYLMNHFNKMQLVNLPKDFYLFGSFRQEARGNVGPKIDFIPGPTKLKVDTATKRWEKIVKIGLGINMTMYAMKKHGANMKLMSGISIEAISDQFGHSKVETTKIYTTMLNEINRIEVLNKSPNF